MSRPITKAPGRHRALTILLAALAVTACGTATPYRPETPGQSSRGGYSDQQIEANRYRVTFRGNSLTARETVETYLLYRAAQLTVERGYDWFIMADRQTDKRTRTYIDRPFGPGPYGFWGPYWRYHGRGFGWHHWDPFWGDPFWDRTVDVRTVDRYEASAEIVLGRGRKPDDPRAFDARQVMTNLGPRIVLPR
ncbi:hypothetical protein CLG96_16255 [Sphingomonas oleivorans]|uniref:Lipoprotein n=1 Tax=Sphingomonas oleivorans TaxID=1735121 RepID=A0A2T5FUP0_9SPHN|nr:hypothetical protein [Sphingomonas oleivorans]PTQ08243.1 hypothetical protein CLG96_16255 [Sphingomonas oleivorans]